MNIFIILVRVFFQICIAIWNGLVGLLNLIIRGFNQKALEKNNRLRRGVLEDKSVPIDSLFVNGCMQNTVISGSEASVRNRMILNAVMNASASNMPVVIFHESNSELEYLIQSQIPDALIVNQQNQIYDPFFNRSESEIIRTVLAVARKEYAMNEEAKYALKGMIEFLTIKNRKPTLAAFSTCPYDELSDKIDNMVNRGGLSDATGNKVKSYLFSGQKESLKLESFFTDLIDECGNTNPRSAIYDVKKAVSEHKVMLMDIGNSSNSHFISVLAYQIEMALRSSMSFCLLLDGISISKDIDRLVKLISVNSPHLNLSISTDDLYAMLGGDEKLMYTLLGNSMENIIMQHGSAISAEEWSKAIGFYEKTETTTTTSRGKTKGGFSLFPSYNDSKSIAYATKREPIVKSEEIVRMAGNEMYIYDRVQNELRHCYTTN